MKRLLSLLSLLAVALTATAQIENSIVLDSNTFRVVQTDALTGVSVDPIGMDSSRQTCARVKIKFANMNRAEVDALEIKFRSNTDLAKRKVADYFDNVLILEMTAKPNTRFYVVSPDFGESNEVMLNLEGDREYEMLARLNQSYSIVVESNAKGAEVYLDGVFKNRIGDSGRCTLSEVMIGGHTLKVVYGSASAEQKIDVNKDAIFFRQNVNTEASKPQYVVFAVEPKSAVVTINNTPYSLTEGSMMTVLESGTYNYVVAAAGYNSQSGTFAVAGQKVEKVITLTADAAKVTLTAPNDAEIWVNGSKKGSGSWSGTLNSGVYIFEARKAGHRPATISQKITSDNPTQSYTLPALTPMVGSVSVVSTPLMADVTVDGKAVGRTPIDVNELIVGEHQVTISKAGYSPYTQTIAVAEGKTVTVNATLTKQTTATPTTPAHSGGYKVGDYYNENGKEGVVFEVTDGGRHGKIVSMKESPTYMQWCSDSYEQKRLIGADSETDGAYNMSKVKAVSDWQSKYPAFKWCADLGDGWYLPAKEELRTIYKNKPTIDAKLKHKITNNWYWSSTEDENYLYAYRFTMNLGLTSNNLKGYGNYVRAVSAF
ncbi:MAG: PEGA domain-containing protein [Alistipes sp.]|nr:PEGA domain-containing protein [Alistipes sp.]